MASGQDHEPAKILLVATIILIFLFPPFLAYSAVIDTRLDLAAAQITPTLAPVPTLMPTLGSQQTPKPTLMLKPTSIPIQSYQPSNSPLAPSLTPSPTPNLTLTPQPTSPTPETTPVSTPEPTLTPITTPTPTQTPAPTPVPTINPTPTPPSAAPQSRIKGVSVNWCFYDDPSTETISHILAGWQSQIYWMKQLGFNSVRLMIAPPQSQATTIRVYNIADLTSVINFLGSNGFTITLDCHNWQGDMQPTAFGSAAWHDFWMQVSAQYKDNSYVIAYELMNEPYPADCTPDMTSWQSIQAAYGWLIHDIRSTGDNKAIILADPQFWQPPTANNDIGDPGAWAAGKQPLLYLTNVIVTTHNGPYTAETSGGLSYNDYFNYYAQRLYDWRNVASVINGEISFRNNTPDEIVWVRNWISFLDQVNIGYYIFMSGSTYQYALSQKSINQVFGFAS